MTAATRLLWWLGAIVLSAAAAVLAWRGLHAPWVYDEAYNLQVVRNLAAGRGYATDGLLHGADGLEPFDFRISTGPVLLGPTALIVKLLGEGMMVYRLVPVGAWLLLLALLALLGRWVAGRWGALAGPAALVVLDLGRATHGVSPLVSPGDVLGEFLATALVVAAILAARTRWVGVLLGLAVMTKTVMFLAVPVVAWALVRSAGRDNLLALRRLLLLMSGVLLPVLAWQVVRLMALGPELAAERNRQFVQFFRGAGSGMIDRPRVGLLDRIALESQLWGAVGLVALLAALVPLLLAALRARRSTRGWDPTDPVLLLIGCGAAMQVWWLFLADMDWVRHVIPGAVLLSSGLLLAAVRAGSRSVDGGGPRRVSSVAMLVCASALVAAAALRVVAPPPPEGSLVEQADVAAFVQERGGYSFVVLDQAPELAVHEDVDVRALTREAGQRLVLIDKWWALGARELCATVELRTPSYMVCRTRALSEEEFDRWRSAGDE